MVGGGNLDENTAQKLARYQHGASGALAVMIAGAAGLVCGVVLSDMLGGAALILCPLALAGAAAALVAWRARLRARALEAARSAQLAALRREAGR